MIVLYFGRPRLPYLLAVRALSVRTQYSSDMAAFGASLLAMPLGLHARPPGLFAMEVGSRHRMDLLFLAWARGVLLRGASKFGIVRTFWALKKFNPHFGALSLPMSYAVVQTIKRDHFSRPATPLSWSLTVLLGFALLGDNPLMALAIAVQQRSLLRRSNVLRLTREDVISLPGRPDPILVLQRHKTGGRAKAMVPLRSPVLAAAILRRVAQLPAGGRLFPFTAPQYDRALKLALARTGLTNLGRFTSHSFRGGGATEFSEEPNFRIENLMIAGLWVHLRSCLGYVQRGALQVLLFQTAAAHNQLGAMIDPYFGQLLLAALAAL